MHLAVDFGARFADFVAWDATGTRIAKLPVGSDPAQVLGAGLDHLKIDAGNLAEVRIVTTAPLNALLERRPQRVALLTTRGFADTLRLGRQNRVALYDPVAVSPAPAFLVDPQDIHEVGGRFDAAGAEIAPFDSDDLSQAIAAMRARGVTAVALCFLFAHVCPDHERRAAAAIAEALPGVTISLSHVVDPAPREYERTVSTVLDAWLAATAGAEVQAMQTVLAQRGFDGTVSFGDGRGVLVPAATALKQRAILLAGAPAAAARAAAAWSRADVVLSVDIGSLSADITLARDGDPVTADQGLIAAVPLRSATVDMASVALGGARAVRRGDRGLVFDATDPKAPTLEDALRCLGAIPGDRAQAEARLAGMAGAPVAGLATEILQAAATQMAFELTRYATRRNVDPSRARLVVMGGSGPLLATAIADAMGLGAVCLPRAPGAAGAMGLAQAARRAEAVRRFDGPLGDLDDRALASLLDGLAADLPGAEDRVYTLSLAARPQMHPFALVLHQPPATAAGIAQAFAAAYRAEYGIAPPGPGHLFQIAAHRDVTDTLPPMAAAPLPDATTRLVETEAGAIWLPEGWHLSVSAEGYLLERSPS